MRYNICSACIWYRPKIMDAVQITKAHCANPNFEEIFGKKIGFPSGVDVTVCDYFTQPKSGCCDVVYNFPGGKQVGYVIPSVRPKCRLGTGDLKDNSQNVRRFTVKPEVVPESSSNQLSFFKPKQ